MKTIIAHEEFDSVTGISTVTIQNKYGHFTGVARCHPDDMDTFSEFHGERVAMHKAQINFLKTRMKEEKIKATAVENLLKDFYTNIQTKSKVFSEKTYQHALTRLKDYQKRIDYYEARIKELEENIIVLDKARQEILLRSKKNK